MKILLNIWACDTKISSSGQKASRSSAGFGSLSALTGDICNPNIRNSLCVLLSCRDKVAVCVHLSPEQTFFFSAFTSCVPLVTCLVVAVKIKVSLLECGRSRDAWRISPTVSLFFSFLGWALIYLKPLVIAQKQDVWAEGSTPLRRVRVLQCNIDICSTRSKTCRNLLLTKSEATQSRPARANALKLFAHKLSELLISHPSLHIQSCWWFF